MTDPSPATLQALLFDAGQARGRRVRLALAPGRLVAEPVVDDAAADPAPARPAREWPLREVQWPERTRHVRRVLHTADGCTIEVADGAAFDAWRRAAGGPRESLVVRAQQHWRATGVALVLLVALLGAAWRWGVPAAATVVVAAVPHGVDEAVGEAVLGQVDQRWLDASKLPPARQQALRAAFAQAVEQWATAERQPAPPWRLEFRRADKAIGPNAFALPGGTIVMTDQLVELLEGHDDTIIGVLGHELGHVQRRHGMHALVQFTLLSAATSVALGDFSAIIAGVPAVMAQMGYSRDAEREADADAVALLRASGRSPAAMVVLFEKLGALDSRQGADALPIAFASHPADAERIAFFRAAAERR